MNQKVSLLHRPRRLRRTESLRLMTQEHQLTINDLIFIGIIYFLIINLPIMIF